MPSTLSPPAPSSVPATAATLTAPRPSPWAAAMHRCARPLIALATQLRTAVPAKPAQTGQTLTAAVETFERELANAGCDARTVTAASYVLCVWLDEVIAPHAWAAASLPGGGLLAQFHGEADGRARAFQLLERLMQKPEADRPLLELFHVCLSLGWQGRWQDVADGPRQLVALRKRLADLLQLDAAPLAPPLSTRWEPAVAVRKLRLGRRVVAAGLMLIALAGLGVYTGSQWLLARQVDQVFAALQGVERASLGGQGGARATAGAIGAVGEAAQPNSPGAPAAGDPGQPTSTSPEPSTFTSPPPPAQASKSPGRMAAALGADVQPGQLMVRDEPNRSTLVLPVDALFEPLTTQVAITRLPLLDRVAQALAGAGGRVLVTAYAMPDAPRSSRLATASQLADEWASTVARLLQRRAAAGSVSSEGRVVSGDVAPAAGGTGPRGNQIEITWYP